MKYNISFNRIKNIIIVLSFSFLFLVSCKKEEVKPFGAVDIDYEAVERINKDGPSLSNETYAPPISDKIKKESGPWATSETKEEFPYFEGDGTISEDDVPIFVKERD